MRPASSAWLTFALLIGPLLTPACLARQGRAAAPPGRDPLAARVTLAERSQPIRAVLRRLDAPARPLLRAGGDAQWERVSVYARNRPLREIKNGLSRLLNYTWVAEEGDAPARYTLWADARAREFERDLWRETLERGAEPLREYLDCLRIPMETCAQWMKAEEQEQKGPEVPILRYGVLYYLARPLPRAAMQLLTTLSSEQRLALLADGRYWLAWNAMTPGQQALARALAEDIGRETGELAVQGRDEKAAAGLARLMQSGLRLSVEQNPVTCAVGSFGYSLGGAVYFAANFRETPPVQERLPVRGSPYTRRADTRPPIYPALEPLTLSEEAAQEVAKARSWPEALKALSQRLSWPLFSDDYAAWPLPKEREGKPLPDLTKLSLPQALDALCDRYHYLWWQEGGALCFRSRTWFIERQYEVSPDTLALLQKQLQTRGRLDAQALTALSRLTRRQIEGLNSLSVLRKRGLQQVKNDPDSYLYRDTSGADGVCDYLQVYALLDARQKERVLAPDGLPVDEMTPAQQQALLQTLLAHDWTSLQKAPGRIRLRVDQRRPDASEVLSPVGAVALFCTWNEEWGPKGWLGHLALSYELPRPAFPETAH